MTPETVREAFERLVTGEYMYRPGGRRGTIQRMNDINTLREFFDNLPSANDAERMDWLDANFAGDIRINASSASKPHVSLSVPLEGRTFREAVDSVKHKGIL